MGQLVCTLCSLPGVATHPRHDQPPPLLCPDGPGAGSAPLSPACSPSLAGEHLHIQPGKLSMHGSSLSLLQGPHLPLSASLRHLPASFPEKQSPNLRTSSLGRAVQDGERAPGTPKPPASPYQLCIPWTSLQAASSLLAWHRQLSAPLLPPGATLSSPALPFR